MPARTYSSLKVIKEEIFNQYFNGQRAFLVFFLIGRQRQTNPHLFLGKTRRFYSKKFSCRYIREVFFVCRNKTETNNFVEMVKRAFSAEFYLRLLLYLSVRLIHTLLSSVCLSVCLCVGFSVYSSYTKITQDARS